MIDRISMRGARSACLLGLLLFLASTVLYAEDITLNLKDADIEAVITSVSEITGKSFIVDPRVKGKVTIISSEPMDADTLYQTFLAVLDVHGFAAIPAEGAIKITPAINARQSAGLVATDGFPGTGEEYVTRVIGVQNVNAMELVPILRPLLPQDGHLAAVARSNVLIASGLAGNMARLVQIIDRIDRSDDEEVEVIRLSHASAVEVVRVLKSLDAGDKGDGMALSIVADERSNSVLLSGAKKQRLRYRAIVSHLDTPLESEGGVEVIYLNYADAKELAPILVGVSQGLTEDKAKEKGQAKPDGNTFIEADESSNSLVINAPPDILRSLRGVVRKLDFRRAQIHVEAIIAEVTTETANELGVQWGFQDPGTKSPTGVINFSGAGSGVIDLGREIDAGNIPTVDGLTLGVGHITGSNFNIAAVIRALAADANNNILATPSLMTLDNQEAEIVVGKEVPFLTGSYTSTGGGSTPDNPFQTYERKDVGLSLKVQPQINEGDAVRLTLVQEVSSISSTTTGAADLVTNKRKLSTSVMVDDGQIIVLGGLIDEALRESEQRVPLLGDLPVLGNLFRYDKVESVRTNLMVFLRPTIVRDAAQAANIAGGKYEFIRSRQLKFSEPSVSAVPRGEVPMVPEWNGGRPAITPKPEPSSEPAPEPEPEPEPKPETSLPFSAQDL